VDRNKIAATVDHRRNHGGHRVAIWMRASRVEAERGRRGQVGQTPPGKVSGGKGPGGRAAGIPQGQGARLFRGAQGAPGGVILGGGVVLPFGRLAPASVTQGGKNAVSIVARCTPANNAAVSAGGKNEAIFISANRAVAAKVLARAAEPEISGNRSDGRAKIV
jgi:hypothetical protein